MWVKRSKYGSRKTEVDGIVFDSLKESRRYVDLRILEHSGEITGLELQPMYQITVNGKKICKYYPDFRYHDRLGKIIVEDCKGVRTGIYRLKKKLMLAVHGIEILES